MRSWFRVFAFCLPALFFFSLTAPLSVAAQPAQKKTAAIGENLIKEVYVLPGPPQAERGTFAKLPFGNAGGCKGISDMLEKLERQQQQEAAKH